MTGGSARRIGAAAFAAACLVAIAGQASAEVAPTLAISDASVVEGTGGAPTAIVFTVTRSGDLSAASTVTAATPAGPSADYAPKSQELSFAVDDASETFSVDVVADDLDEPTETFVVTLSAQTNATLADATGTGTINDDDATPTLSISGPAPIEEHGTTAGYSVTMTGKSALTVTVNIGTANVSATAGQDYNQKSGQLVWPVGTTGAPTPPDFTVSIREDALDENDETFNVTLSGAANATIATATATTTITDDDDPPIVKIAKAPDVTEGDVAHFPITLDRASGRTVNVTYRTANGTAQSGSDFNGTPNATVQIAAGTLSGEIAVQTIETLNGSGQKVAEPDETFSVALIVNPTLRVAPPDDEATAKIVDDEVAANPTLNSPSEFEGNPEPDNPTTNLAFQVSLQGPHPAMTFNYRTVAGTADGTDFVEVGGNQVSLPVNTGATLTKQNIVVQVRRDLLDEHDEQFKIELLRTDATGAKVAEGTGTIRNDDNNSKMSISDAQSDEPGTMTFNVTLSQASAREVKVNWATANGTATAGSDYTAGAGELTFSPGDTTKSIDVAILGDGSTEENETLKVNLSGPTGIPGGNVTDGQGDGTIIDRNAPPSLSVSDTRAAEGSGATFTITLAGTTLREVKVNFTTSDATAKAGSDYTARAGTLTFAPGERTKQVAVTVLDDTAAEPTEDFFLVLGDPINATITKNRGLGAIDASDQAGVVEAPKPPTTTKPPVTVLVPRMILGPRTVTIGVNGVAKMLVTCQKASPILCAGTVELQRAAKPLLKLGKRTFTVKKGGKGFASIKLSARTLAILRKSKTGTLRAKVFVIVKTNTKKTMRVSPGVITLKGTKAFLKAKPKKPAPPPTKVVVDP